MFDSNCFRLSCAVDNLITSWPESGQMRIESNKKYNEQSHFSLKFLVDALDFGWFERIVGQFKHIRNNINKQRTFYSLPKQFKLHGSTIEANVLRRTTLAIEEHLLLIDVTVWPRSSACNSTDWYQRCANIFRLVVGSVVLEKSYLNLLMLQRYSYFSVFTILWFRFQYLITRLGWRLVFLKFKQPAFWQQWQRLTA